MIKIERCLGHSCDRSRLFRLPMTVNRVVVHPTRPSVLSENCPMVTQPSSQRIRVHEILPSEGRTNHFTYTNPARGRALAFFFITAASVPSGRSSRTVKLMAVHVVHVDQARIGHTLSSKVSHHTSEIQPAAHGTFAVMSQLVHNLLFLCTLIWAGPRPVDPGRTRGSEPYLLWSLSDSPPSLT